jgi:hydrogenase nickel incorporation protein HypA/HybF
MKEENYRYEDPEGNRMCCGGHYRRGYRLEFRRFAALPENRNDVTSHIRAMHELSIAMSILDLAQEESDRRGATVEAIYVRLGALSGVVSQALASAYDLAREGTQFENCRLLIEDVPVVVYCTKCDAERPVQPPEWFRCPQCNTPASELISGRELQVRALEFTA